MKALKLEEMYGLDKDTIAEYEKASTNLISVSSTAPIDKETLLTDPDPVRLFMIAGSLSKQAQAPNIAPYEDPDSRHIDRRQHLQGVARETLRRASGMLMGLDSYAVVAAGEFVEEIEDPAEVVVSAAVEAARDTETQEMAIAEGIVGGNAPQRLRAGGENAVLEFIDKHAKRPNVHGREFISDIAEYALKELAGPLEIAA